MINTYKESSGEFWTCIIMLAIVAALILEAIIYF
jgi:hypothetical protein